MVINKDKEKLIDILLSMVADKDKEEFLDILLSFTQGPQEQMITIAFERLPEFCVCNDKAIAHFHDLMHDHDPEIRELAASAFVEIFSGDEAAYLVDKVARLLSDPNYEIVEAAVHVIMWIGNETYIPLLKKIYDENTSSEIKEAIWVLNGEYWNLEKKSKSYSPSTYSPFSRKYETLIKEAKENYKKKSPDSGFPREIDLEEIESETGETEPARRQKTDDAENQLTYNQKHPLHEYSENYQQLLREMFQSNEDETLIKAHKIIKERGLPDELSKIVIKSCLDSLPSKNILLLRHIEETSHLSAVEKIHLTLDHEYQRKIESLLNSALPINRKLGIWFLFVLNRNLSLIDLESIISDSNEFVRIRLIEWLSKYEVTEKESLIKALIHDPSAMVRCSLLHFLSEAPSKGTLDIVKSLLNDPIKNVRHSLLEWLCDNYGPDEKTLEMFKILMHDPDPDIREEAVLEFENSFSTDEVSHLSYKLIEFLYDPNEKIVEAAAKTLMWAGNETHIQLLKKVYTENPLLEIKLAIWVLNGEYQKLEKEAKGHRPLWLFRPQYSPLIERAKENFKEKSPVSDIPMEIELGVTEPKEKQKPAGAENQLTYNQNHPLSKWLGHLREIRTGDIVAYMSKHWPITDEYCRGVKNWPTDSIRLARMLHLLGGRDIGQILESLADWHEFPWDDENEFLEFLDSFDNSNKKRELIKEREIVLSFVGDLKEPIKSLLKGSGIKLVQPKSLFSVRFAAESSMFYSTWGWSATAYTSEFAVLSEWGYWDGDEGDLNIRSWIPKPLGLISRKNLFKSAALLLSYCGDSGTTEDPFTDEDSFWQSISVEGINPANVYRLLLAAHGRGGLLMSESDLKNYQESDMSQDYRDLIEIIS